MVLSRASSSASDALRSALGLQERVALREEALHEALFGDFRQFRHHLSRSICPCWPAMASATSARCFQPPAVTSTTLASGNWATAPGTRTGVKFLE